MDRLGVTQEAGGFHRIDKIVRHGEQERAVSGGLFYADKGTPYFSLQASVNKAMAMVTASTTITGQFMIFPVSAIPISAGPRNRQAMGL